ncbi:SEP-domain-containing protein [Leucogyrophana mollusca]|uniref:SEP-domain-containing protein n=1 Tax=Leucogyrophana mollusca TaxID=85980 RepID=A0ACB8BIZ4_9AGAM|nr:SEP-domain-containing protein [Leucogyrophana mollusca]
MAPTHTHTPTPAAAAVPPPPNSLSTETAAVRHVTFWRNGFSFGDGALLAYGDPANQALLAQVNAGLAPPRILNVVPGQLVELRVAKRITEDYTPPLPARPSSS